MTPDIPILVPTPEDKRTAEEYHRWREEAILKAIDLMVIPAHLLTPPNPVSTSK